MLPSLSATKPCGPDRGVFRGYSLNSPVLGSSRPSLIAPCPVYQSEPSGASAGSCGRDFGVGTSYSLICTLSVFTAANAAIAATSVNNHNLRRDMTAPPQLKIVIFCSRAFQSRGYPHFTAEKKFCSAWILNACGESCSWGRKLTGKRKGPITIPRPTQEFTSASGNDEIE